ncbi:DNA cytosine methyltransferase [Haliscomenobacter hydrossis]|uniref:DNA (cytosine-5-)-methyltransferase n=1 Tax=Haliscomenobacter hydrossis (strain ATCC 27775 / DSM 1100 / LMG 10767 / O) TaxID=760192 RepID=F4L3M5_HALH1|nr:DNA (cytosine-5-)-methyltransferase [Haliscomenobacter hydrossis]AEE53975.1 DNA-cytosine methyltransferase [Haliscomenobacter hydrossis DSM 1100]
MSLYLQKPFPNTCAEFFAGIGLMRLGLEQAGWEITYANDIDPIKDKIYQNHFQDPQNHFQLGDIHQLDVKEIPYVTLATASFPCTDLSLAGRREGLVGKNSSAYWGFIKVLKEMGNRRPRLILLENVEGFLTSNKGEDFKEALLALNSLGYSVDAFVIDAAKFVPQSRVRLFVVGKLTPVTHNLVKSPQLSFYQSELRTHRLADFILNHPEINWDIRQLRNLPKRKFNLADIVDPTPDNSAEWWNEERVMYLLNQTFDRHRVIIDLATKRDEYSYFTAFRRVRDGRSMAEIRSDGIAGCLRTPKGGSARQILLKVGKGQVRVRLISPRECAKLMGADDYKISSTLNEALFGFGDAVCVPVVKWIAENYLNPLLNELNNNNSHDSHYSSHEYSTLH